jgi:hypothetical protein
MPHPANGGRAPWYTARAPEAAVPARRARSPRGPLGRARDAIRELISAHPLEALAGGLGLGVILGWLVKRR